MPQHTGRPFHSGRDYRNPGYKQLTDEELVQIVKWDTPVAQSRAFAELFSRYRRPIISVFQSKLSPIQPADVEDLVSEFCRLIWKGIPMLEGRFKPWAYAVAKNQAQRYGERRVRERQHRAETTVPGPEGGATPGAVAEQDLIRAERFDAIIKELEKLRERDRDIFTLRHMYELPVAEIARRYDISETYVTTIAARVAKRVRDRLINKGIS